MLGEPLKNLTRLPARLERFHDVPATAREPVPSSDMLGGFFCLDAFDVGLHKLGRAQP
jgi:hypothetical protein